jgi:hypothetical protein
MPPKSKAQFRFAQAAKAGKVPGVSKSVGQKILHGAPSYKKLPARKSTKR